MKFVHIKLNRAGITNIFSVIFCLLSISLNISYVITYKIHNIHNKLLLKENINTNNNTCKLHQEEGSETDTMEGFGSEDPSEMPDEITKPERYTKFNLKYSPKCAFWYPNCEELFNSNNKLKIISNNSSIMPPEKAPLGDIFKEVKNLKDEIKFSEDNNNSNTNTNNKDYRKNAYSKKFLLKQLKIFTIITLEDDINKLKKKYNYG